MQPIRTHAQQHPHRRHRNRIAHNDRIALVLLHPLPILLGLLLRLLVLLLRLLLPLLVALLRLRVPLGVLLAGLLLEAVEFAIGLLREFFGLLGRFVGGALALALRFFRALGRELLVCVAGDGGDVGAAEGVEGVDAGVAVGYFGDCTRDSVGGVVSELVM
jgi:hypothetical protein